MSLPATAGIPPSPSSSSRIASGLVTACTTHISDTSKLSSHGEKRSGQSKYLTHLHHEKDRGQYKYRRDLYHELGRFKLWCRGFYEAPPGTAYLLDSVLDGTRYLKEPTTLLLASLARCLLAAYPLWTVGNERTRRDLATALDKALNAYPHFEENMEREPIDDTRDTIVEEIREYVDSLFDVLPTLDNVLETMQEHVVLAANPVGVPVSLLDTDMIRKAGSPGESATVDSRGGKGAQIGVKALNITEPFTTGIDPPCTGGDAALPEMPQSSGEALHLAGLLPAECSELMRADTSSLEETQWDMAIAPNQVGEPLIRGVDPLLTGNDPPLQEVPPVSGQVDYSLLSGWNASAEYSTFVLGRSPAATALSHSDNHRLIEEEEEDQVLLERVIQQESPASPIHMTGNHWEIYQQYIRDRFPKAIKGLDIVGFAKGNAEFYESLIRRDEELGAADGVLQAVDEMEVDYEKEEEKERELEQEQEHGLGGDCESRASQHTPILSEEPAINDEITETILEPTGGSASRGVPATFKDSGLGSSAPRTCPTKSIYPLHHDTVHIRKKHNCTYDGCGRAGDNGFFRRHNLIQHMRNVHRVAIKKTRVRFGGRTQDTTPIVVAPNRFTSSKSPFTRTPLATPPSVSVLSASTICSTTSEPKDRRLLPRVPDHSGGSPGFTCTFCGCMQLSTIQGHAWRKHVFTDLKPYMCIRSRCRSAGTFYTSKRAWVVHDTLCIRDAGEGAEETTTEMCPFCLKDFGRDTGRFYSHVAHHMEDIRLFALPPAFREYEVGEYKESSGVGSSENMGSSRDRPPIQVYVSNNKAIDPGSTMNWIMTMQTLAENEGIVAGGAKPISVISLEPEDDSMGRAYRRALGGVTPAGTKWQPRL